MTDYQSNAEGARHYNIAVDLQRLRPRLLALAEQAATAAFTAPQMMNALAEGLEEAASLMRAVPIQEGNLLEQGIALLAATSPDLLALTENIRLPVTSAALQLVALNDEKLYRRLTLDADTGGRKGYTPDILLVHQSRKLAYVVDVKRTLTSYESTRIAELKNRMLASALVVPDLLYKEHRRIAVDEVRAVILNADSQKIDIDHGVWPLSHLDHLLEIDGAGLAIEWMRSKFAAAVERNWNVAIRQLSHPEPRQAPGARSGSNGGGDALLPNGIVDEEHSDGAPQTAVETMGAGTSRNGLSQRPHVDTASPPPLRVGLARMPEVVVAG